MYISILLDETSDISCYSQLSTALRYVNSSGFLCERFIQFTDVSKNRSATAIYHLVMQQLTDLEYVQKLVAQTYNGAAVMSGEFNGVQAKIKEFVPDAIFIHCYAHKLNLVLSQATSVIPKCSVFFATLNGFLSFFTSSSKRTAILDDIVEKRFPRLVPTRWSYSSLVVETIRENMDDLKQLFECIIEDPKRFDPKSINEAQGFFISHVKF